MRKEGAGRKKGIQERKKEINEGKNKGNDERRKKIEENMNEINIEKGPEGRAQRNKFGKTGRRERERIMSKELFGGGKKKRIMEVQMKR